MFCYVCHSPARKDSPCPTCGSTSLFDPTTSKPPIVSPKQPIEQEEEIGKSEMNVEQELIELISKSNQYEKQGQLEQALKFLERALGVALYKGSLQKKIDRLKDKMKKPEKVKSISPVIDLMSEDELDDLDSELSSLSEAILTDQPNLPLESTHATLTAIFEEEPEAILPKDSKEDPFSIPSGSATSSEPELEDLFGGSDSGENLFGDSEMDKDSFVEESSPLEGVEQEEKKREIQKNIMSDILGATANEIEIVQKEETLPASSIQAEQVPVELKEAPSLPIPPPHIKEAIPQEEPPSFTSKHSSKKSHPVSPKTSTQKWIFLSLVVMLFVVLGTGFVGWKIWKQIKVKSLGKVMVTLKKNKTINKVQTLISSAKQFEKKKNWEKAYQKYLELCKISPSHKMVKNLEKLERKWIQSVQKGLEKKNWGKMKEELKKLSQNQISESSLSPLVLEFRQAKFLDYIQSLVQNKQWKKAGRGLQKHLGNHFTDLKVRKFYHHIQNMLLEKLIQSKKSQNISQIRKFLEILQVFSLSSKERRRFKKEIDHLP